jgi:hypothetical protein
MKTVQELIELEKQATPGPVIVKEFSGSYYVLSPGDAVLALFKHKRDAELFAESRNAATHLLAIAEAAALLVKYRNSGTASKHNIEYALGKVHDAIDAAAGLIDNQKEV